MQNASPGTRACGGHVVPRRGAGPLKNVEDGKSTWLRVTRKEEAVSVSYSFDASTGPSRTPRPDLDFPDEVTVGVFFAHSTYQTLSATFDGFTVEKPSGEREE